MTECIDRVTNFIIDGFPEDIGKDYDSKAKYLQNVFGHHGRFKEGGGLLFEIYGPQIYIYVALFPNASIKAAIERRTSPEQTEERKQRALKEISNMLLTHELKVDDSEHDDWHDYNCRAIEEILYARSRISKVVNGSEITTVIGNLQITAYVEYNGQVHFVLENL